MKVALSPAQGTPTLYHGGPSGLSEILPPSRTGAVGQAAYGNTITRDDRVYLTTSKLAAAMFAIHLPDATVYEVRAVGVLESDPDCDDPSLSFMAESASIIRSWTVEPEQRLRIIRGLQS